MTTTSRAVCLNRISMFRIVFEVAVEQAKDACPMTDAEEEDNLVSCILDALGFPESVKVTAKLLRREEK